MRFFISFFCIAVSIYAIPNFEQESKGSKIICLKGTCCAGKTTLIQSIVQQWDDMEIVDEDPIVHRAFNEAVAQRFPMEYVAITEAIAEENLYHALRGNDVLLKRSATEEACRMAKKALCEIKDELNQLKNLDWKKGVNDGIRREILEDIQFAIEQGKNVLLDSWYFTADQMQEQFPETPTVRVLLYCPFPIAYERLLMRNAESIAQENLQEKRYMSQLMGSFCSIYELSSQPSQAIHSICRQELDQIFNFISSQIKNVDQIDQKPIFTYEELSRSEFQKLQAEFMQPFLDCESATLFIAPKERQDLIIDFSSGDAPKALIALEKILHLP